MIINYIITIRIINIYNISLVLSPSHPNYVWIIYSQAVAAVGQVAVDPWNCS